MNTKYIVIFIAILTIVGFGAVVLKAFQENTSTEIVPTPTPDNLIFNQEKNGQKEDPKMNQQPKQYQSFPGIFTSEELQGKKAIIETTKGNIELEIYPEASKAASNFIFLAKDGFYNGLTFHRVVPGFVIQGGDPLGNGRGGPGYQFEDEPVTKKYDKGIVAMANAGPNTNGSQFFIMLADHPELPPLYTIFGKVTSGQDVVEKIQVGDVMKKVSISQVQ